MENGPFIDGLPINSMVIFHGYVSHNQMVYWLVVSTNPLKNDGVKVSWVDEIPN